MQVKVHCTQIIMLHVLLDQTLKSIHRNSSTNIPLKVNKTSKRNAKKNLKTWL